MIGSQNETGMYDELIMARRWRDNAGNCVTSCDLVVVANRATEPVAERDPDVSARAATAGAR